jgi:type II secretory pathway component GspD/PulD (secretin)
MKILAPILAFAFAFANGLRADEAKPATAGGAPGAASAPTKPASGAAKALPPARNIRFQFDGIPYGDVVERFAQMAGKPLLSDTNVVGTLTYDDPNSYAYNEALDTLNQLLATRGVMLIEDGNNLRLVPFKELPSMPIRILRGAEGAGGARPGEVVTVVLDANNIDSKEMSDAIQTMLSGAGSMAVLGRGRGVVITDKASNIQRIRTLLATITSEQPADRQMKTYTLHHSSGAIVSDLLNRTFGVATAPKRTTFNPNTKALEVLPPDPNEYITSVFDEASRTLLLFGPPDRIALAEELINKFEQKEGSGGDVRIYYPQTLKAEELANLIRQAIPGVAAPNEPASAAATKARVITDATQNRVIVAAPVPGQLDEIEQLVLRVDKGAVGAGAAPVQDGSQFPVRSQSLQVTRIFRPRATEATNVAAILKQALTRRDKFGQVVTSSSVSYDAGSQSVVVTGPSGDMQIAADIVSQLETGTSQPTPLQTRFIEVGTPEEARRLLPLVEQLYRNQTADGGAGPVAHAKIMADTESGRLIVTASQEHLARIESLVKQLRTEKADAQVRRLKVIALKNTRAEAVTANIQSLVSDRMADRRFVSVPKPSIVADPSNNRLLVTATDDQLREIEDVVGVVDVQAASAERQLAVLPLTVKPASEIISLVTQLLPQFAVSGQAPPTLLADPTGRQIIVLAAVKDQERIRTLVQQFDVSQATSAPRQFRGVELFGRTATEFTPLVQQLYTEQLRGQPEPAGGPATLIPETRRNRIMVSGSEKEIARVEGIIRQLDPAAASAVKEETRVIRLKTASASEIVGLVDKSLNAQTQQVRVLLDARSNSLVVTGSADAVEAAWQMIQQLDTRGDSGPRELRLIELKSGDAATVAPMVNNLFTEMLKDQHGPDYTSTTKITPDTIVNRLVVTGPRDEIDQVAQIVARLDNSPTQAPGARVFKLNASEAVIMAPIVSNAMLRFDSRGQPVRRVAVTADEKSNSLIISGARADVQDAEAVVEKLDGETTMKERTLRIFDVRGDADGLATLAQKVFAAQNPGRSVSSLLSITPEPATKRLIVLAPVTMMPQVEQVIMTLDAKPEQGMRELHSVELKNATATELLPKVSQIYAEQSQGKTIKPATIYPDASGNRLLVQGTEEQKAAIQQIVTTLEAQARPVRETRTFEVGRLAEAQRLLPLARQLYQDQLQSNPQLGSADAQLISDGRTGRLIVSARSDQMKVLEGIITGLQAGGATNGDRETRTFDIGSSADVQRLQPLIEKLYQDQWKDRQDTDPADAQIVADPRTGRIIVTGKPDHLKRIEAIVKQLGGGTARVERRETRILDLTTASAVELSATVRTLYLEEAKSRLGALTPDTLITPDAGGNRIIVVGDTNELSAVEDIVRKLDKTSAQGASARVFKIKSADPDKVAEILSSSLVRYDAYGRPQKRANVSVDPKTRTLIVTADPKELQGVALIIEQLDQSLGSQPERKMKTITLQQGRVATLSPRVRQIFNDRIKSQPELSMSDVLILDEAESNQLILAGSEAQLKVVEEIVNELQAAQVARASRETKLIDLGTPDEMTRLQPLVQQLYQDRWKGRDNADVADAQIIADAKNARFIVTGRSNHIAEIEAIVAQLRGDKIHPDVRDTRIFDLVSANAADLAVTVRTLYQEQAKTRPGAPAADTLIVPDQSANRIIVTANTNELEIVDDIIKKLDKVGAQSATTRVFKMKSADPEKVVEILGTALVRYDAYGRPQKRVAVVTDAKSRTIIATGDPKELQSASVIIEQLDQSLGAQPGRMMRVIGVKDRNSAELVGKVQKIYQDQARNNPELGNTEPLILDDPTSNQLIVAGSERQLVALEEIVLILQKGAESGGRQVKIYPLDRTSASSLVAMLQQVYSRQVASVEPSERLVVSAGGNDRTLVVDAPANLIPRVEDLVRSLDQPGPEGQNVIQTVRLNKGRAEDLAEAVNRVITNRAVPTAARRVSVTAVGGANSLLINGPTNAVQDVMRIIHDLDQEGNGATGIEVRIFKLENGVAKEVSQILQQLLDNVTRSLRGAGEGETGGRRVQPASVTVDEHSNSLIISATPAHFKVVEKILPTLDKAPERSDRDVQFVWLRKAKADDVESKLESLFSDRSRAERPVIEADSANNSLTIIARRGDLAQIQDLVTRLDQSAKDSAVQVRVRPLDHMAADQMAEMLRTIYPQMSGSQVRITEKLRTPPPQDPAATNAAPVEPGVVLAVDKAANALILSGPGQELDAIDRLISDLSFNFYGHESEFRLFNIKDADPVVVARTLTELLRQDAAVPQPQPGQPAPIINAQRPRITVVAEPRTRSVIVRARPTDFALMESLIKQLDNAGASAQLDFRIVPLVNASPDGALPMVQQMVQQMNATRPGDPVSVSLAARDHGLLVIARGSAADQVEMMVKALDKPSPNVDAEVRIIPLKRANATQLATILQGMLKPGAQGESTPEARELQEQIRRLKIRNKEGDAVVLDLSKPIKIAADAAGGGNRIILTSTPSNLSGLAAVVDMMDTFPVLDGVAMRIVPLEHADAATVSQTLTTIFTQGRQLAAGPNGPGGEPGDQGKALVHPLNVSVDARSNSLIIAGQPESIGLALKVIQDMDRDLKGLVTDVKLFKLKYASATRMLPLLQAVFAEGTPVPGSEGLSTQVTRLRALRDGGRAVESDVRKTRAALTLQADEQANVLVVAARSDNLPVISEVIDQLDIPAASGLESVRIFPLEHADPIAVQKVLTDLYSGPRTAALRPEDRPIITVDPRTSALIIAGKPGAYSVVENLIKQLDQKLPFDLRDIALVPLEHADAGVVAPTLQKLMDARVTQRATLNQGAADALKVIIMYDQRSNSLLVGGAREGFDLVRTLAKQLDDAAPALSGRVRLIPMKFADARVIAATMSSLFEQRYAAIRTADVQRSKPIILADARSNALLVAASQEDNRTLDDLLAKLDAREQNPALPLAVLQLRHNDSGRVATVLENIFAARLRAQTLPGQAPLPSDSIKIEPDPLNNALVVSASKENLELLKGLLEKLDQEPTVAGGVLETFTLEFADAQRVATILKSLVDQGLYRPGLLPGVTPKTAGGGRDILSISVDPRSNTLIVSASPENLVIVREVIKRIDNKDVAATADVKLYQLQNARASTLAATLTQYFQAKRNADSIAVNAGQRLVPATVIPDDRVNTILVTGGKEAFEVVERLLPQLDGDSVFSRLNFRVFPLKKATALKMQATLQPIFANRPPKVKGEPVDPITIVADQWVNALLVGATVDDLGTVASLIERLDDEPTEAGLAIHVFPLAKGDARRIATTVQGLFRENLPNQVLPITVTADERINAIVVSCGETDARRIGELVQKLDTDQVAKVSEIRVFPLHYARADALSTILNTALNTKPAALGEQNPNAQSVLQFITRTSEGGELVTAALKEGVLITPDPRMNSLIVSAPADYMGLLEQVVTRLDASSPQEAKIKVFALRNADARQMGEMITQLFKMTPAGGAAASQRSVQYTFVKPATSDGAPEEALATATVGTAEQSALTVTIDPRTNSLLVGGADHYVELVTEIIETLDSSQAHERNSEVIRLRNSQAADVATAIRQFLDQERQKLIQNLGADAAMSVQRQLDQEVAVVAEPLSNTLLLSANQRYFDQVRSIIDQIDVARPQVLIQVVLAEVTLDNSSDFGVEWKYTGVKGANTYGVGTDYGVANQLQSLGGFSTAVSGSDFNFLLRALKTDNKLEVLSRPQIVTADNKPATINVGQRVPLIDTSRLDVQNNLTTSYRYEDVGVNLTVTPKISSDGFVQMEIGTTNSDISASSVAINKSSSVPIINQRKANTTVSAQSGQTIIIGGLISTSDQKLVKKLPVLGDIPYIGALFRSSSVSKERKELIILLTPQVLENTQSQTPLQDPDDVTRRELDNTGFKSLMKTDEMRKRILEPLYPTNPPPRRLAAPPAESPRKSTL